MGTILIRYIDLPCRSKGCVERDADGDYNVYINARLSFDIQQGAIQHELNHIANGDFDNGLPIEKVEELGIKL